MTSPSIIERSRIAQLKLDHIARGLLARFLLAPPIRWYNSAPEAEQLLLVPQELRTSDVSFVSEIEQGMFGLGGTVASMGAGSVFDIKPPSPIWARDLHGFSWLRHLSAVGSQEAVSQARRSIAEWLGRHVRWRGVAWQPDVVGRRVFSWIANADLLLEDCAPEFYDQFLNSLVAQLKFLTASWYSATAGRPRLTALIGLTIGDFCIAGREAFLERSEHQLAMEIERQFYADGGHISRNPHVVVDVLLDLIPLRSCYQSCDRELPENIATAIPRMLHFLQFMRLGDGSLAHFHGAGTPPFHALATLATYADADGTDFDAVLPDDALQSGYVRLTGGDVILLIDGGKPPPLQFASHAAASCLAFEFSVGAHAMFVNGGTPGVADKEWLTRSRSTSSHNTLVLGAQSSSEIIDQEQFAKLIGGPPIRLPEKTSINLDRDAQSTIVEAQHDGYHNRFGLLHRRRLRLDRNGFWIEGRDQIVSSTQTIRLPRDIPFSIHFHLHPEAVCLPETSSVMLEIKLPDGSVWQFTAKGATLSIEESIYYAGLMGPAHAQQIVLRGSCFGDQTVQWRVEKA